MTTIPVSLIYRIDKTSSGGFKLVVAEGENKYRDYKFNPGKNQKGSDAMFKKWTQIITEHFAALQTKEASRAQLSQLDMGSKINLLAEVMDNITSGEQPIREAYAKTLY